MDRVKTLYNKLQEQISGDASTDDLLLTTEMIRAELLHLKAQQPDSLISVIAVDIPSIPNVTPAVSSEKVLEILRIDENEVEAELEEIKKNLSERNKLGSQGKPAIYFDALEDTPTLIHQDPGPEKTSEVHEFIAQKTPASLHDKYRLDINEESLASVPDLPIKDLRKGVGVNDRFLYINDLFRGDGVMYERSIKTINGFNNLEEAELWIKRELKLKLGWDESNEVVKQFDQLIKRRFS